MSVRKTDLIEFSNIKEKIKLIEESNIDYISENGNVYTYKPRYNKYYKRVVVQNPKHHYNQIDITLKNGRRKTMRVHRLVAKAFIPNPDNYDIVGHKDNIKTHNWVENLYWTDVSENTQKAFDDGLIINAKGFEDNQSIPIDVYDLNEKFLYTVGSIGECAKMHNVTKQAICYQCKGKLRRKPRKGYIYKYSNKI